MIVTAFLGDAVIGHGAADEVTRLIEDRYARADHGAIRVFDDADGRVVDLDYWDAGAQACGRAAPAGKPRGRPKLGVVAREVTMLPRHWEWLARQRGGASAALRRLVDGARREEPAEAAARDAAYRFMADMCGDRPGYEEALRALYRGDRERLDALTAPWPADIRAYLAGLLDGR
jgi:hypothetical protein